jgi:hypothetical protein
MYNSPFNYTPIFSQQSTDTNIGNGLSQLWGNPRFQYKATTNPQSGFAGSMAPAASQYGSATASAHMARPTMGMADRFANENFRFQNQNAGENWGLNQYSRDLQNRQVQNDPAWEARKRASDVQMMQNYFNPFEALFGGMS